MKSLYDFIVESLLFEEEVNAKSPKKLLALLQQKPDLSGYVDVLNAMLKNADAKKILIKAFLNSKSKDYIDFTGKIKTIPVKDLHPTQSEIDVDKSIGYPFIDTEKAKDNMNNFFNNAKNVKMPFPLITFNGTYIVDGHHRWSQVFSFNPDASMECFDLTIKNGVDLNAQDVLKIVQGLLAAKRAEDGKGDIPKSVVNGSNLFDMDENAVKSTVLEYCKKSEEVAEIIRTACKQKTDDELASYICNNLMLLRKDNVEYAKKGNSRGVMPQTDKGGDNPDKEKGVDTSALPGNKRSALSKLVRAHIDKRVVPSKK